MFICNRCKYTTNDKSNFVKHLKKINMCDAIDKEHEIFYTFDQLKELTNNIKKIHSCSCGKLYSNISSLVYHKKTCLQCKSIGENNLNIVEQVELLKEESILLKEKVKQLEENQKAPIILNDNRKLIINSFGKHDISYIKDEFFHNLLELPETAIKLLSKEIYDNDEHPENKNVKITDNSRNIIKIYKSKDDDNGKWIKYDKKRVVNKIIELMAKTFKTFIQENGGINNWSDKTQNKIYEYVLDSIKLNPEFYKQLQKDIILILLNCQVEEK